MVSESSSYYLRQFYCFWKTFVITEVFCVIRVPEWVIAKLSHTNFSQSIRVIPLQSSTNERMRGFKCIGYVCGCEAAAPPLSSPSLSPLLPLSSPVFLPNPPSDPRGKLSLFAEIGMSIPAPLTQVCSSPPSYWGND